MPAIGRAGLLLVTALAGSLSMAAAPVPSWITLTWDLPECSSRLINDRLGADAQRYVARLFGAAGDMSAVSGLDLRSPVVTGHSWFPPRRWLRAHIADHAAVAQHLRSVLHEDDTVRTMDDHLVFPTDEGVWLLTAAAVALAQNPDEALDLIQSPSPLEPVLARSGCEAPGDASVKLSTVVDFDVGVARQALAPLMDRLEPAIIRTAPLEGPLNRITLAVALIVSELPRSIDRLSFSASLDGDAVVLTGINATTSRTKAHSLDEELIAVEGAGPLFRSVVRLLPTLGVAAGLAAETLQALTQAEAAAGGEAEIRTRLVLEGGGQWSVSNVAVQQPDADETHLDFLGVEVMIGSSLGHGWSLRAKRARVASFLEMLSRPASP